MNGEKTKSNLTLKIIAVLIAIFLWFYVVNDGYEIDFLDREIPIEPFNLSENLVLVEDLGDLALKVRAPLATWSKIDPENISAYVDLKNLGPGEYNMEVKVSFDDPSIQALEKIPETVLVRIGEESISEKEITVKLEGSVGEGYVARESTPGVAKARIFGAKDKINEISQIVATLKLEDEMSNFSKTVPLVAYDEEGSQVTNISLDPKSVEVKVEVSEEENVKTVGIKPKLAGNVASGYWVSEVKVNPASISIKGAPEEIEAVEHLETETVNLSDAKQDFTRKVSLSLPEGVSLLEDQQFTVTVIVESSTSSREFSAKPEYRNTPSGLIVTNAAPSGIRILVEGKAEDLEKLQEGDLRVILDLKGKGKGEVTIPISENMISLPAGFQLKDLKDKQIKLTIQ